MATSDEMRPELLRRLGRYCSYCEYPVAHLPHAEHIIPKDRFPAWRDRWDNLLVACSWCNGHKGDELPTPDTVDAYLLPHRDNTMRAFVYSNRVPEVSPTLAVQAREMAARTRGLVRFDVHDDRTVERDKTFVMALRYSERLRVQPGNTLLRETIEDLARAQGFFSIWMLVFDDDVEMRQRFIHAFVGTSTDCFDAQTTLPVPRPGGRI